MDKTPAPTGLADQVAALSDALERQRREFQEAESALVTRIADVDDDRRLTTNRLQRAWQTHHDEVEARFKRQQSLLFGGLMLLALLFGIAFAFSYSQLNAAHRALLAEHAQMRLDYERLAAVSTQETSIQESLDNLRGLVAGMSKSLAEVGAQTGTQDTRSDQISDQAAEEAAGQSPDQSPEHSSGQVPEQPPAVAVASAGAVPASTASIDKAPSIATSSEEPSVESALELSLELDAEPGARQDGAVETIDAAMAQAVTPDAQVNPTQQAEAAATAAPPVTIAEETPADLMPEPTSATPDQPTQSEPSNIEPTSTAVPSPEPDAATIDAEPATPDTKAVGKAPPPVVKIVEKPQVVGKTSFALQLIGFYSLDSMLDFARREQLPSRVYYREESYQGRPWFVLIHSLHGKKSDASEAMAQLPKELAMLDTFIRSFSPETQLGILEIER